VNPGLALLIAGLVRFEDNATTSRRPLGIVLGLPTEALCAEFTEPLRMRGNAEEAQQAARCREFVS
jgi:hypothetical protein